MDILEILKIDLQISVSSVVYDNYLKSLIQSAKAAIKREGIDLKDDIEDGMLVEIYAAYLYRSRRNGEAMPEHLRYSLNNRLLSQKAKDDGWDDYFN